MKTICDLKQGDSVWVYAESIGDCSQQAAYDHGKVRERTVKNIEFLQDERGHWDLQVCLTRCRPYELYAGHGTMEEAKKIFERYNRNYGYFYTASQKIWTDKDELKKWLEKVSNTHRRLYHKYARRARMYEFALDRMIKAMEELG